MERVKGEGNCYMNTETPQAIKKGRCEYTRGKGKRKEQKKKKMKCVVRIHFLHMEKFRRRFIVPKLRRKTDSEQRGKRENGKHRKEI